MCLNNVLNFDIKTIFILTICSRLVLDGDKYDETFIYLD